MKPAPVSGLYHDGHRELQTAFDTVRLADRLEAVKVHAELSDDDRAFIEGRDMFFLATADAAGRPTCSYKGGDPGFVRAPDRGSLLFPCYDGNGMFLSFGNALANPPVGLLFIDFEQPRRLRVEGNASLERDAAATDGVVGAQLMVRVRVERVFPNCPRYIHKYRLVERSSFVPRAGCEPPIPGWKRTDWARDVLPASDPARGAEPPPPRNDPP